jgi:small subunit ribosomal protein S17
MADVKQSETATPTKKGRILTGTVISNKMNKTITVRIERREKHPIYGKYLPKTSKVHAHDEENKCQIGDLVTVRECRPISKLKTWMLQSIDGHLPEA